jgi:hypothetical protein
LDANKLLGGSELIRPGCPFKVAAKEAYQNWGIEITPDNRDYLRVMATYFHQKDLEQREEERKSVDPRDLTIQPYAQYLVSIIHKVAEIVKGMVPVWKRKKDVVKICILGARRSEFISHLVASVREANEKVFERTQFYIIEPSQKRLERVSAELRIQSIKEITNTGDGGYSPEHKTDAVFFSTRPDNEFDLIIPFFLCHDKSFTNHLLETRRKLRDDGAILIADTFSPLWQHPLFVYKLLSDMHIDTQMLQQFKEFYSISCSDLPSLEAQFNSFELAALNEHKDYWLRAFVEIQSGRYPLTKPIFLLKAHRTVRQERACLEENGFSLDKKSIRRRYHSLFRAIPTLEPTCRISRGSDYATILLAIKEEK